MKALSATTFLVLAAGAAAQGPDAGWSAVPAAENRAVGTALMVPAEPGEDSIRLVSPAGPQTPRPLAPPRRVFGLALAADPPRTDLPAAPDAIPGRAHWPDASGRILEDGPAVGAGGAEAVRNPWIPRLRPNAPQRSAAFVFGGFIAGGAGGPVAILNGRSVRRGAALGDFVVDQIGPAGVVLERADALYVVPPGIRTTITLRLP